MQNIVLQPDPVVIQTITEIKADIGELKQMIEQIYAGNAASSYMDEKSVMQIFAITNRSHWSQFMRINKIPHYKVGRSCVYRREDIDNYVKNHRNG